MNAEEVIAAMKAGATLHMEMTGDGRQYWLSASRLEVGAYVGNEVIDSADVKRGGDCLFGDDLRLSQTYRAK